jgi:hypothetical protein
MQTTVNLPDSLYERCVAVAVEMGATVEQLMVNALQKEVSLHDPSAACGFGKVELPLIPSRNPGVLDLSQFDFDDLLT